jgi:hypothetical protein
MIYLATIELGYNEITHRHFYYSIEDTIYYCKDVYPDNDIHFYYLNNIIETLRYLDNLDKCKQMISPQNIYIIGYYRYDIFTKKLEELAFEKAIFPKILNGLI